MGRPRIYANPSERAAAWKKRNPEKTREQNRRSVRNWRTKYPERDAAARAAERQLYGVTIEELDALEIAQAGVCAICGEPPKGRKLSVDHDHATGKVRGLLCRQCNLALGMLGDDPGRVQAAADYLRRYVA